MSIAVTARIELMSGSEFRSHEPCEALLIVEQDRIEIGVDIRTPGGWTSSRLTGAAAELMLPSFGLRCLASDLYEGTPLQPRNVGRS